MLSVFLNWIYILITTMTVGGFFTIAIQKKLGYKIRDFVSMIAMGLVAVTVYAQFFSLFYKVGFAANLILCILCVAGTVWCRLRAKEELGQLISSFTGQFTRGKWLAVGALFLIWIYFTSKGIMHYDSDLYHAQSIRWIEEYGVVKGLSNLQVRFAYNSSVFALSAFYSMKFLTGHSLHAISGFFAFLLSVKVLDLGESWKEKCFRLSDFARLAAFYYLTLIADEVVAPASDYAIMCTVFYLVITWLSLLEKERETEDENITPYALLCVGGAFAVTLKLTAGLILLLVIKPAKQLLERKQWKQIGLYLLLGILTVFPWMARTVMISGYLLYPFPALDIFSFDWKMPAQKALLDSAEIKVWGRALYDISLIDVGVKDWFGNWFQTVLTGTEKVIILADLASLVLLIIWTLLWVWKRKKADVLLAMWAVATSYLFWQLSAPLPRYGYAYMLLMLALPWGYLAVSLQNAGKGKKTVLLLTRLLYGAGLLVVAVKLVLLAKYGIMIPNQGNGLYLTWQQPYGTYEVQSCEIEGVTFYYPVEGDRVGYEAFPSSTTKPDVIFRGEALKDGFIGQKADY